MSESIRISLLAAEVNTFEASQFEKAFFFSDCLNKETISMLLHMDIWSDYNKYNNLVKSKYDDFKPRNISDIEKVKKRLQFLFDNYEIAEKDSEAIIEKKRKEVM